MVDAALLGGRYRLIEPIGRGGMAEVWRADDMTLRRHVAIKMWPANGVKSAAVAGAWREARDAAQLVHPNAVGVYDVAVEGDRPFLVMELVEGPDLATVLARHGPLPYAQVAQIGAQAARALAAAHAVGVVHCDVKPGNLLVNRDGTVKLADFGLAGSADRRPGAELPRQIMGTTAYLAPERVAGLPPGPASDLYSLGCVLYELLVGRPPFQGTDAKLVIRQHVQNSPAPPGRARPDIPAELEHAVLRLLAKNPADRPDSAGRIALVLHAIAEGPAPASPDRRAPVERAPGRQPAPDRRGPGRQAAHRRAARPLKAWLRERPLPATAATALVVICVLVTVAALIRSR